MKLKLMINTDKRRIYVVMAMAALLLAGCSQNNKANVQDKQVVNSSVDASLGKDTGYSSRSSDGKPIGKVLYIMASDFKKKVMDYEAHPTEWVFAGDKPAVIDFYATWCRPCKMMSPIVEELAKQYRGKVDFYKVDVDQEKELASVFDIQSIPTFLFVPANGQPTVHMGALDKKGFENMITQILFVTGIQRQ